MAVNVRSIELWRTEVENQPGALARTLGPLAEAGIDLHVIMGYRYPGNEKQAAIEVAPILRPKAKKAAEAAGLKATGIAALMVEGKNRPGLGHAIGQAIASAGINLGFLMAQVVGKRYSAIIGCETDADAKKVAVLIRKATGPKKRKKSQ